MMVLQRQRRFATWLHPPPRHIVSAMADEVQTLKRELEALKLQLQQERRKNTAGQGVAESAADSSGQQPPERQPVKRGGDAKAPTAPKVPRSYVQHAAVGARQGKWWLRDRQVLSRATPEDGGATLKVRETWVWSGRTVILDKIVRVEEDEEHQEGDAGGEEVFEKEGNAALLDKKPEGADLTSGELNEDDTATSSRDPQQSHAAETSEEISETAGVASSPPPAKGDDEVRESSAPELSDPEAVADGK